eukprot:m.29657 g.29657  ORF g.29657 m.29657 type:complete len:320 (-) comp8123_c0_seq3:51-1010(-)
MMRAWKCMVCNAIVLVISLLIIAAEEKHEDVYAKIERYKRRRRKGISENSMDGHEEKPQPMLALPGPAFPQLNFDPPEDGTCSDDDKQRLIILDQKIYLAPTNKEHLEASTHAVQTSSSVWTCAIVLVKYLEHIYLHSKELNIINPGAKIVELGSGTGIVGIGASIILAHQGNSQPSGHVYITDVAEVVPSMQNSIDLNSKSLETPLPASGRALDWTKAESDLENMGVSKADVVLAADVVWVDYLIEPLVTTLEALSGPQTVIYFAYQSRSSKSDKILFELLENLFTISTVSGRDLHPDFQVPGKVEVYIIKRKPQAME